MDKGKAKTDGGGSEYARATGSSLRPCPTDWHSRFAMRQAPSSTENKPYIESRAATKVEEDKEARIEPEEDDDLVRDFMRGSNEIDICLPSADLVEAFCDGANLQTLRKQKGLGLVALLIERCIQKGIECPREPLAPLTAVDLLGELRKPRIRSTPGSARPGAAAARCLSANNSASSPSITVTCPEADGACGVTGSPATAPSSATHPAPSPGPTNTTSRPSASRPLSPLSASSSHGTSSSDDSDYRKIDAEQRLVYITDLDRWTIVALIRTASYYQAFPLRDALYKHLSFEPSIGMRITSEGLQTYQIAFHLPYYVWRSSPIPNKDHRCIGTEPLRETRNVSFLNDALPGCLPNSPPFDFLYEAQMSCVIAGFDKWSWDGYFFCDAYFDDGDPDKESVGLYYLDNQGDELVLVDPFARGELSTDRPLENPINYFLTVFRVRLCQIQNEWQRVVNNLLRRIRIFIRNEYRTLSKARECSSSKEADNHAQNIQSCLSWIAEFMDLQIRLSECLSKTVDAGEKFWLNDTDHLEALFEPDQGRLSVSEIKETFGELQLLLQTLNSMATRCDNLRRSLEAQLHVHVNAEHRQRQWERDNKGLLGFITRQNMSASANNAAAWLKAQQAPVMVVDDAHYTNAGIDEVVIKTTAMALNPADVVVEVGPVSTSFEKRQFKIGDRVFGSSNPLDTKNGVYRCSGFQKYVVLKMPSIAKIPAETKYEDAVVLSLGVNTAASCLFASETLGLSMPDEHGGKPGNGKTLLVWGGSSSVGSCGVQLATQAGYEVMAVASKKNHNMVRNLGASECFDQNDPSVVDDMVKALDGKDVIGAYDAISTDATLPVLCEVLSRSRGRKLIVSVMPGAETKGTRGVEVKTNFGTTTKKDEVGKTIWMWLEKALKEGRFKCMPQAEVVGKGLEDVQKAIDILAQGVSAKKLVIVM
ncbi:uncharacterized protein Z518_00946 [Rhinocladiella mackenziei CBS 650.93]|uniref:Enoyl reductase (ER) domain-containing protein n=1 Tax=Rhinocladiella mackenziei CBS 650.93 TaxID=1442369 RepID=A0A0D2JK48_9EURO|nr:uncharacterized protein Z518_00946 [Rhinocladiella mackenziei CBS 650.93]KIX09865.1 hypothetical protein Z518_00946 [Rhinocladiella mackenziei CBS 650.93]